jgi:xanthine dehydrogenase iron-sulfur cluster and FAD-binding subunit A
MWPFGWRSIDVFVKLAKLFPKLAQLFDVLAGKKCRDLAILNVMLSGT